MSLGVITGSGTHALPRVQDVRSETVSTPWGACELSRATLDGAELVCVSRHGEGHARLSNHIEHRANVWALRDAGVRAVVGCTVCGAVDPKLELGSLVAFDDVFFPSNRLPDGTLCTFFDRPGAPGRGHLVLHGAPLAVTLRELVLAAGREGGLTVRDGGTYGHVDGPRFNSPSEIAWLASVGVVAVSQTGGPEAVLCAELELPYALLGFLTDYANEVRPGEPTPVSTLTELIGRSGSSFAQVLGATARQVAQAPVTPAGTMLRFP